MYLGLKVASGEDNPRHHVICQVSLPSRIQFSAQFFCSPLFCPLSKIPWLNLRCALHQDKDLRIDPDTQRGSREVAILKRVKRAKESHSIISFWNSFQASVYVLNYRVHGKYATNFLPSLNQS